jgi:hypothetical protein
MSWRARLVPLVVREWFRLAVYDFCDRNGVLIRPIGKIHENAAGFCGDADTGHLLVRKTSHLVEICGGDERSDKRKREGKANPHKTDSPLVPGRMTVALNTTSVRTSLYRHVSLVYHPN